MDRNFYLDLAQKGLRMPIGTDLILNEKPNHAQIPYNGKLLGEVMVETANRYKTPLAFPLMDLKIEKSWLAALLEIPENDAQTFQFEENPSLDMLNKVKEGVSGNRFVTKRMQANCEAIKYVAQSSKLLPVGMSIGPFSMMTTLLKDPIIPVFMSASGMTSSDEPDIATVETALEMSITIILKSIKMQLDSGAKAICVCEPAANNVYISQTLMEDGSDIFDRYVISYNKQITKLLSSYDADLIFHDCGELIDKMVLKFNELDPAILSLGSSRKLWEDASLIQKNTVLFGNIPTKKFYSDKDISKEQVRELSLSILENMKKTNHPFILASECDVLSVPGATQTIVEKINAMLTV